VIRRPVWLLACASALAAPFLFPAPQTSAKKAPAKTAAKKSAEAPPAVNSERAIASRWLQSLTLRQRVAQLVVVGFSGRPINTGSRAYQRFIQLVAQEQVGGLILVNVTNGRLVQKADPLEAASFINRMQRAARIPLLVAGDFERGASMRLESTTVFPHAMAFGAAGDPGLARREGEITAMEARAMGVQWLLFPDADVNNNPDNPIINIRSYGEDPENVSRYVKAFVEGAHAATKTPVLVTAKHFPGHGDTAIDTHMNLATIAGDRDRLEQVEFAPFRAAVESGADSVMTAHLAVPAIEAANMPATLSGKILQGVLRDEMKFRGIIVTDAMEMGGIAQGFSIADSSVRAIEAGADVLLMPSDPVAAINAVTAAVTSGRISRKHLDESVMRVLTAKAHLGLATKRTVDLDEINTIVNSAESNAVAQQICDRAATLIRNNDSFLPLTSTDFTAFFLLAESATSTEGVAFASELHKRAPRATAVVLHPGMSETDVIAAAAEASGAQRYVVAAFASFAAYRGSLALGGALPKFMDTLTATGKPIALLSMGNPYMLRNFPSVSAYLALFSTVPPSEISAVKALFGEIAVSGRIPVSIPGLASLGDGISLPARAANGQ
jgi:beta-N-acetylhexosaminidase